VNDMSGTEVMGWSEDRVQLLMKLWNDGRSASQIASELGGVTRNAVIGKVHRLGLSGRAKTPSSVAPRAKKPKAPVAPRTSAPVSRGNTALKPQYAPVAQPIAEAAVEPLENVVPIGERCTLLELKESSCRWPIGDPGKSDFLFCGGKSDAGVPYCAYHCRIAYQPVADRRRRMGGMGR
jgi:GcrA cell cycle regulator